MQPRRRPSTGSSFGPSFLSLPAASPADSPEPTTTPSLAMTSAVSNAYQASGVDGELWRAASVVAISTSSPGRSGVIPQYRRSCLLR